LATAAMSRAIVSMTIARGVNRAPASTSPATSTITTAPK